jgi:glycosyltransferase involved in cell wall biosynthesis
MLPRVAVVVSHPIQHFCPFYRAIARSEAVCLKVYFTSYAGLEPYFDPLFGRTIQWQSDLIDGFDHEFLPGSTATVNPESRMPAAELIPRLAAFNPDAVVVYGYARYISRYAIRWTRRWHKRLLYISDAELRSRRDLWKMVLKKAVLPYLFSKIDAFLTVGDSNEAYYSYYGVDRSRFFRSPFPFDEESLRSAIGQKLRLRQEIRQKHTLPEDALVALTVGKLIPRKRIVDVVRAVCSLWHTGLSGKVFLLVAGDGPERDACETVARAVCPGAIRFAGFVPVTELPAHYVASDVLLHPSSEDPHPLAISEAVACGLPCIVSDRVGSVGPTDDVRPGVNGWEYPMGNFPALACRLRELVVHRELLWAMSDESFCIGRQRGTKQSVDGFLRAVVGENAVS